MTVRITHIRKPNRDSPYEAISHYGQLQKDSVVVFEREWLIDWLKDHDTYAYVSEDGDIAICEVKNNGRINFLQTKPDASQKNNLLNLPPC